MTLCGKSGCKQFEGVNGESIPNGFPEDKMRKPPKELKKFKFRLNSFHRKHTGASHDRFNDVQEQIQNKVDR